MINLILILIAIAIILSYYFWTFNYWKRRGVKSLTPNLLFGNLTGVAVRKVPIYGMFKEVYDECKKSGAKFMGFYFLTTPALVIVDPNLIKQVLITDFSYFLDRLFYRNEKDPLTINISSAKGNQWKKMREQLSPAFSPSKLKYVCCTLLQVSEQLKSVLDKSAENYEVVNLKDVCGKYMVDAIGTSIFGIECNTLKNRNMEFKKFAESTFGGSFIQNIIFMLSMLCPSILTFFRIPFSSFETQTFYSNLVKSIVENREKNKIVRNDLMHSIIQLRNNIDIEKEDHYDVGNVPENEKSLKIQEITAQALLFFGAAYETSSSTISLCIYELALHEDVQNKVRKEITNILEKYAGKLNYDVILEMTYLDKCISETLRKNALVGMTSRTCTKRYKLPDTDSVLDVGTTIYIPIYEIHHDPEYYPNPDKFDPERFSSEMKATRQNYTFLSFGDGQRGCIGARLGLLEVKIFLITFLSNYNFTINSKVKLPASLSNSKMIISLENPLYLNIEKITKQNM